MSDDTATGPALAIAAEVLPPIEAEPVPARRGRPKGATNKNRVATAERMMRGRRTRSAS